MVPGNHIPYNTDLFDDYFKKADLDGDGMISGAEAVAFSHGSNLPKDVLAQVWMHADQQRRGYLGRQEFYNALKLVTVAQCNRDLTPETVKATLYGPASAKIPAPLINLAAAPTPQSNVATPETGCPGSVGLNQQHLQSQQNQDVKPTQANVSSISSLTKQYLAEQGMPVGGNMVSPGLPTSNSSTNLQSGSSGSLSGGVDNHIYRQGNGPSTSHDGYGQTSLGLTPSTQPTPLATTRQTSSTTGQVSSANDPEALVVSENGSASDSVLGDSSTTSLQSKQTCLADTSSATSSPVLKASIPGSGPHTSVKPKTTESLLSPLSQQPLGCQYHPGHPTGKHNQQGTAQSNAASSTVFPAGPGNWASSQSTPSQAPWPTMTQSDLQKYTKIFEQVDADKDGKITGYLTRKLFLSWKLPREVIIQVWDLSDQDCDGMISLREFCTALYLIERYREGRHLPSELPNTIVSAVNAAFGSAHGFQQPQVISASRPSLPSTWAKSVSLTNAEVMPSQQKSNVPVLEKNLVDQVSQEEQDALNAKFKEATEENKKVKELEKEILDSKAKIKKLEKEILDSKAMVNKLEKGIVDSMQKLVVYKKRCEELVMEILDSKTTVEVLHAKMPELFLFKRRCQELEKEILDSEAKVGELGKEMLDSEAKVGELEKEMLDSEAKVVELGKEILDSKAIIESIHANMQELVLSKSKCDNRLNEISKRAYADKREVEVLLTKSEENYRQFADVASRLSIEELTFRDIQERMMELYQAIVKVEQGDNKDGSRQERANHILSGLEKLVKSVNEPCKQYGIRAKPTSLVEPPFGWQPGIHQGAAGRDDDRDQFEDTGSKFVKELSLDVQNDIAPPKPKPSPVQEETVADANTDKVLDIWEWIEEKDLANDQSESSQAKSLSGSPTISSTKDTPRPQDFQDSHVTNNSGAETSPYAQKTIDPPYQPPNAKNKGVYSIAVDANTYKILDTWEWINEEYMKNDESEDSQAKSLPGSLAISSTGDQISPGFQDSRVTFTSGVDSSPHDRNTNDPYEPPNAENKDDPEFRGSFSSVRFGFWNFLNRPM